HRTSDYPQHHPGHHVPERLEALLPNTLDGVHLRLQVVARVHRDGCVFLRADLAVVVVASCLIESLLVAHRCPLWMASRIRWCSARICAIASSARRSSSSMAACSSPGIGRAWP